VGELSLKTANI